MARNFWRGGGTVCDVQRVTDTCSFCANHCVLITICCHKNELWKVAEKLFSAKDESTPGHHYTKSQFVISSVSSGVDYDNHTGYGFGNGSGDYSGGKSLL